MDLPPDRFGVVGMGERARLLGGSLTIETSPGGGTAIDVVVPLGDATTVTQGAP